MPQRSLVLRGYSFEFFLSEHGDSMLAVGCDFGLPHSKQRPVRLYLPPFLDMPAALRDLAGRLRAGTALRKEDYVYTAEILERIAAGWHGQRRVSAIVSGDSKRRSTGMRQTAVRDFLIALDYYLRELDRKSSGVRGAGKRTLSEVAGDWKVSLHSARYARDTSRRYCLLSIEQTLSAYRERGESERDALADLNAIVRSERA